MVSYTENLLIT